MGRKIISTLQKQIIQFFNGLSDNNLEFSLDIIYTANILGMELLSFNSEKLIKSITMQTIRNYINAPSCAKI